MITGANFKNKGAQSMLFVAVDEIKRRYPDAQIFFGGIEKWKKGVYSFDQVFYRDYTKAIAMGSWHGLNRCVKTFTKDVIKTIAHKGTGLTHLFDLKKIIRSIDLILDISGFNIGRQWAADTQEDYFDNIRLAKTFQIPMVLMPQSFGPFNYDADRRFLLDEAAALLPYPRLIFAREIESRRALEETFGLDNIELSADMVLQNKEIDLRNIFVCPPEIRIPTVLPDAVGIVPNAKCAAHGNEQEIMHLYSIIIHLLAENGKNVYIFNHSSGDRKLCTAIYENNKSCGNVQLITEDFNCFEYNEFIRQFDFIICSRYHGIVNAYRNNTPSIILGWAEKYAELAQLVGQKQFQFDITDTIPSDEILHAVKKMVRDFDKERVIIRERMKEIQEHNCFDRVWEQLK